MPSSNASAPKSDASFPGRMLLAEVNQWPEDCKDYFGDGDECHMAFHFPLMPRMYMAIAREDRFPISDIMRQTPSIPETCQWAVFLRNHDELTLEMVTDSERDYLWQTYAADRRARINLGIRRRLAPLLERDRRRIELMNSLLLSMPGTPVIYYGDEIGMGDNIHLGDRNGVRTPMQWSPDRNGGFSRADPAALVLPPIMDPLYGYDAVNVEAQSRDPHSILNWMRRMLAVRRRHPRLWPRHATLLYPKNRKILAYFANIKRRDCCCVSQMSRTAPQAVELDLSQFAGRVPVELNAGTPFPPIGELTYLLTLPPYGFYWFALAPASDWPAWHTPAPEPLPEFVTIVIRDTLPERSPAAAHTLHRARGAAAIYRQTPLVRAQRSNNQIRPHRHLDQYRRRRPRNSIERDRSEDQRRRDPMAASAGDLVGRGSHRQRYPFVWRWRACGGAGILALLTDAFALPDFAHRVALHASLHGANFDNAEGSVLISADRSRQRIALAGADQMRESTGSPRNNPTAL